MKIRYVEKCSKITGEILDNYIEQKKMVWLEKSRLYNKYGLWKCL